VHVDVSTTNVRELPVGEYDAVRTLRSLLAQAERGEITDVIVIATLDREDDSSDIWASWSRAPSRQHIWWRATWLVEFLKRRYFSGQGQLE
jgi:hypothetical protein